MRFQYWPILIFLFAAVTLSAKGKQELSLLIDIPAFEKLAANGELIILDIRDEPSYTAGHIPGAVLVPLAAVESAAASLSGTGVPIVTYCACPAEESSIAAALKLRDNGVDGVHVLVGGYREWIRLDKPIVTGHEPN